MKEVTTPHSQEQMHDEIPFDFPERVPFMTGTVTECRESPDSSTVIERPGWHQSHTIDSLLELKRILL
jgi:hypothetical protein